MSLVQTVGQIEYPESDGKPLGETDLHRDWMIRILELLRWRYRDQRVYIASDLLVYYEEGEPSKFVVPDDFVVLDCDPGSRRTFKIWQEGKAPDVVFEVTSRSSRREDQMFKPHIYSLLGVKEYFLYDPTADYLDPPLQGFRLSKRGYRPVKANETGALACAVLGIRLRLEDGQLILLDSKTGKRLQTHAEAADARVAQLEAELARLRATLKRARRGE